MWLTVVMTHTHPVCVVLGSYCCKTWKLINFFKDKMETYIHLGIGLQKNQPLTTGRQHYSQKVPWSTMHVPGNWNDFCMWAKEWYYIGSNSPLIIKKSTKLTWKFALCLINVGYRHLRTVFLDFGWNLLLWSPQGDPAIISRTVSERSSSNLVENKTFGSLPATEEFSVLSNNRTGCMD
jgi:hypothetical protein